ncbi:DeoR family transcriptional regulator [Aliiroseovarius zhejiangensis]|uniref:DeoR family transcriptional regulator n=1 Tax=Aliiroseovarius zhejiangensis TaxID=1632025 RepID=A0ABQ3J6N4_9RHOB|nr:DeoR/GlpR family DNA-binding transcription regulator [Aliiroseovarius zhejiangensis]GHF07376.1 DeoR family transcriptional regulator [Aliiroseovarius zhejiangensis]
MAGETKHSYRELEMLDAIRRVGGFAKNSDLASTLNVSEETVRRTIKALSKAGSVARVHGGAYLVGTQSDPSFFKRIEQHATEKRTVAKALLREVQDGMTLFLDVGSTTSFVAEELRARGALSVVTNSVQVAQTLVGHNNNRVYLLGGEMHADELGAFGHVAEQQARQFCFDLAVLSADALHPKHGFLYLNRAEAELASVVIGNTDASVVAMTHHKFGSKAPHQGFLPHRIDRLIVDRAPQDSLAQQLESWGVAVRNISDEVVEC